jgi:alpha-mannosidase
MKAMTFVCTAIMVFSAVSLPVGGSRDGEVTKYRESRNGPVLYEYGVVNFTGQRSGTGLASQEKNFRGDSLFPAEMECLPQPVYRMRKDGKPGREVAIRLKGGNISDDALIEVTTDGKSEISSIVPVSGTDSVNYVLLPDGIGVNNEANVTFTLRSGEKRLIRKIVVPAMRHWNIYLYNHSHVDIGYTNTQKNVEILHKNNILEGIKLCRETKDFPEGSRFRWNPEVTWPVERLWVSVPDERKNIIEAIRDRQLCIDANYLNLNTSICSDEELFHVFRFSREIMKITGKKIDVFQQMDIPGISWGLIPVLAQEGIRYIMSWPNSVRSGSAHKDIDGFPFWWIGPDRQSRVLFLQPGCYGNSGSMDKGGKTGRPWFGQRDPDKIPAVIRTGSANVDFTGKLVKLEKEKYPYDFLVLSWSLWDNSPPDADIPEAVRNWNEQYTYPHIVISGGHEIMEMIEKKYGDRLPAVSGDYTEYWTDGQGTAAGLSAMNRNAAEKLTQAEILWTMLHRGRPIPRKEFDEAWRYITLSSEHTWCYENPSEPFFQDAIWKVKQDYFHQAGDRTRDLFDEALSPATVKSDGALGPAEGPSAGGIAVFNTNSWAHGGLIVLSKEESQRGDRVTDEQGIDLPAQRLATGELAFMSADVPALGSRHYRVQKGKSTAGSGCKITGTTLENEFLSVTVDPGTGNISSLVNRSSERNFADININGGLNAFRWLRANIDDPKPDSAIAISVVETGPLVVELKITSKAPGCRSVTRSVRLVQGAPWLEIDNTVDKLPLIEKDGIHFGFGFDIPGGITRIDIPWGVMTIEKDQWPQGNRNWLAVQRWVDVSNEREGITWCSPDAPLLEHGGMTANLDTKWGNEGAWVSKIGPGSAIYSWVMNNHWITNFPLTQDGPVTFRYRIMPHREYNVAAANRFGMEQSQPLVHVATNTDPRINPMVALNSEMVNITILKTLDDGRQLLLRLRSLSDRSETVNLSFPAGAPVSIHECPEGEEAGNIISANFSISPYGMKTLILKF